MKIHAQEIMKRNIQFVLFIGTSLISLLAIIMCLRVMAKATRPVLIAVDSNGTRIVSDANDPIYKTEAISFIQKFIFNTYNFDSANFMKRIGTSTSLMSEDLWKRKREEVLNLRTKVEQNDISLTGEVEKLTVDQDGNYHALILAHEKSRMNEQVHKIEVTLKLSKTIRNQDNPYGMEVDSYEETLLRD